MINLKNITTAIFITILLASCSSDDDSAKPVNEEEIITTLTATLVPEGMGTTVTLQIRDLDGDGPNAPVFDISGPMATGVTYNGSIILLNETESPAENITTEVEEEAEEHQFFYTIGDGLDATTEYDNFDSDGNPLGTKFILTAGAASSGTLTFTLRHEPVKPNSGLGDAGGETDIAASFNVIIQ